MTDTFYKTNGTVGTSILFWAKDAKGYTTNLNKAHVYTRKEAQSEIDDGVPREQYKGSSKYKEFFIKTDDVDRLLTYRVDEQHVDNKDLYPNTKSNERQYVAYIKDKWDGNDLFFARTVIGTSPDLYWVRVFHQVHIEQHADCFKDMNILPLEKCKELERPTFQVENLNKVECLGN
ncbi:hypothetical protein [Piscirickettsia litoralis]|uniref:Uncharacterized protein n=1 Tax=Piscirickettsia litoralis TaxID=1891921 RepID=A0ABX2ZYN4_9GAMM|nr:hypothetical protein [Piscirickettsia litoralis]ODN41122.1 hypothetical protein BGC07_17765 [Piscirickettsia litoralis]